MGLDMYLNGERYFTECPAAGAGEFRKKAEIYELGYWRKHPNLHGYIVQAFADGLDECQEIPLGEDRLLQIIHAIRNKELPHTEGCFFGASDGTDEEAKHDIAFFRNALEWLRKREGGVFRSVSYQASW
jgi:hypothetical protein